MKTSFSFFYNIAFAALFMVLANLSVTKAQSSEITEKDKMEQEKVLEQDPKNYAALFVVGAYYYNQAVDPHVEASKMKVTDYLENGESLENKKEAFLQKALPYFENAYAVAEDKNRVKGILQGIYQQLGLIPNARITTDEVRSKLDAKLSEIEFKDISNN